MSMFPPESTTPVRGRPRRPCVAAAPRAADAPLGSSTSRRRSKAKRIAATISSSVTVTTASSRSLDHGQCPLAGDVDLLAVGDRPADGRRGRARPPASERWVSSPTSAPPRHRAAGQRRRRGRAPGDQPAAADRHEQEVERTAVLEQLERRRALAGHDALVVVGVHDGHAVALGPLCHQRLAVGA